MPTLYLVATPIGNLEDFSPRAQRILREVALIAAEDTRHTGKLLKHFGIRTPLTSYFDHNKKRKLAPILETLAGHDVALVSDAGMPGINDPGYALVRAALDAGHAVSPVPGPSAPIAALAVSGLPTDRFLYLGYLPRKSGERRKTLGEVAALPYTLVFLESPHRLLESLADLQAELGNRRIAVAREMTKMYEEIFRGRISEAAAHFDGGRLQGEITLVIDGAPPEARQWSLERVRDSLKAGLARGESVSSLSREIAAQSGWKRREVYRLANELNQKTV